MTWIFGGAAVLCILYYGVIVVYSGFATSFSLIWPVLALVFVLLAVGNRYYLTHRDRVPLWIPVSVATAVGAMMLVFCIVEGLILGSMAGASEKRLDYVIVLGARLQGDKLSNSLKNRLDRSIEYLQENPTTILVLSGGQCPGEVRTEAAVMYEYLKFNGVRDDQMLLELQSQSTVENIAYSHLLIQKHEAEMERIAILSRMEQYEPRHGKEGPHIGILSSNFHLFRAEQIAKKWGVRNADGVSAKTDPILFVHLCVRECFAILKDQFMGNM